MRIEILDGAKKDFLDGFRFYENQSEGVGRYFYDSLMAAIESLHLYAGVHAKQYGFHRMIARRFLMQSTISLKNSLSKSMRFSTVGRIQSD